MRFEYIPKDPSESILVEVAMEEQLRYGVLATTLPFLAHKLRSRLVRMSLVHLHPTVQLRLGSIAELGLHGNGKDSEADGSTE